MGRIMDLRITNYRSVRDRIRITFPPDSPLVLVGENNVGKSNIVSSLDLVLGETWPGSHHPEDHEYYGRETDGNPIVIGIAVSNVFHSGNYGTQEVIGFNWQYPP